MFDDLNRMDWLVILTALALGFGLVRFLIAAVEDRGTGLPLQGDTSAPPEPTESTADVKPPPHER